MQSSQNTKVLKMSQNSTLPDGSFEIIDSHELAKRLGIPESWVYRHTTSKYAEAERIPAVRFGKYIRFRWGSPELNAWLSSLETK